MAGSLTDTSKGSSEAPRSDSAVAHVNRPVVQTEVSFQNNKHIHALHAPHSKKGRHSDAFTRNQIHWRLTAGPSTPLSSPQKPKPTHKHTSLATLFYSKRTTALALLIRLCPQQRQRQPRQLTVNQLHHRLRVHGGQEGNLTELVPIGGAVGGVCQNVQQRRTTRIRLPTLTHTYPDRQRHTMRCHYSLKASFSPLHASAKAYQCR